MSYLILTFDSTHQVLKAEKILLLKEIPLAIIPTPKEFSSDCGMSIRIQSDRFQPEILEAILSENQIPVTIYLR